MEPLTKTSRREAREGYARFLLARTGLDETDIEEFLNEKQSVLENKSPLELIYSGSYQRAIAAVELFTEDLYSEEEIDGIGERRVSSTTSA